MKVSDYLYTPATLTQGSNPPSFPMNRSVIVSRDSLETSEKKIICFPCKESNLDSSVRPVA